MDKYQDMGTITDPESLGACEPGTAISLEGIVWNETKGGDFHANYDDNDWQRWHNAAVNGRKTAFNSLNRCQQMTIII